MNRKITMTRGGKGKDTAVEALRRFEALLESDERVRAVVEEAGLDVAALDAARGKPQPGRWVTFYRPAPTGHVDDLAWQTVREERQIFVPHVENAPVPPDDVSALAVKFAELQIEPDDQVRQFAETYGALGVKATRVVVTVEGQEHTVEGETLEQWRDEARDAGLVLGALWLLGTAILPGRLAEHLRQEEKRWRQLPEEVLGDLRSLPRPMPSTRTGRAPLPLPHRVHLGRWVRDRINSKLRESEVRVIVEGDGPPFEIRNDAPTLRGKLWKAIAEFSCRERTTVEVCPICGRLMVKAGTYQTGLSGKAKYCSPACNAKAYRRRQAQKAAEQQSVEEGER